MCLCVLSRIPGVFECVFVFFVCVCHIPVALSVELLSHSTEVSEEIERAREREKRQQRLVAPLGHSEWEEERGNEQARERENE